MSKYVEFENPPVIEVVFGVLFSTPIPLKIASIGLFWNLVRQDFNRIEEAAPLLPFMERYEFSYHQEPVSFDTAPRTWLLSADGRMVLQIQRDRFLLNWKKIEGDNSNTFYESIAVKFEEYLRKFEEFLRSENVGEIFYRQFELTYINHIDVLCGSEDGENDLLVDHRRQRDPDRFLPAPEGYLWKTSYLLPDQIGRLHIVAQLVMVPPAMKKVTQLELTARGLPKSTNNEGRKVWFDTAHEWIVKGFVDVTSPEWQERWGKNS